MDRRSNGKPRRGCVPGGFESSQEIGNKKMELPKQYTEWLDAMLAIGRHYGVGASAENARVALAWEAGTPVDNLLEIMARQMGMSLRLSSFDDCSQNNPLFDQA